MEEQGTIKTEELYTLEQLVSFGNYMTSKVANGGSSEVWDSDLQNWKALKIHNDKA